MGAIVLFCKEKGLLVVESMEKSFKVSLWGEPRCWAFISLAGQVIKMNVVYRSEIKQSSVLAL